MKGLKLSHSATDMYSLCGRKFQLYRIEKWRSPKLPSSLFFGSALDEAFSHLLCTKKEVLTETELTLQLTKTAEEVFVDNMITVQDVYRNPLQLAQSPLAEYFSSDFTPELLSKEHVKQLQSLEPGYKLVDFLDFHQQCKEQFKAKKKLLNDDQVLYNYMTWLTLVEKGKLMVGAYRNDVLPEIQQVYNIQKRISISNEDGDTISGLIDFTAKFVNDDDLYICDNKSSRKPYPADSVKESLQLATYCEAEKTNKAAYVVLEKKLFKKEPKIRSSVIKDEIPETTFEKTFDRFEQTCYNVQANLFPKNEESCFAFGRICEFYKVCKFNDYSGLVKLEQEVPAEVKEEL